MSTQFTFEPGGELAFVRWGRGRGKGVAYEFGTSTNLEHVMKRLVAGERLVADERSMDTDPVTPGKLLEAAMAGLVTFGSGDLWQVAAGGPVE